jgi:hypothetical protein
MSGLMSGVWKQGTEKRVRHRQPKGPENGWASPTLLRHTPTLHALEAYDEDNPWFDSADE